jgi:hypothetical protein
MAVVAGAALLSLAAAAPALAVEGPVLTPGQRAEYLAGATSVGGLTQADALTLLNAGACEVVPTSIQDSVDSSVSGKTTKTRTIWGIRSYRNVLGKVLFSFKVSEQFTWNPSTEKLVSVSSPTVTPVINMLGWDYIGLVSSVNTPNLPQSHYRYRQGKSQLTTMWITVQTKLPWVKLWAYGSGAFAVRVGG